MYECTSVVIILFPENKEQYFLRKNEMRGKKKRKTNPIHFPNKCFFKQDLTQAKNEAATYAINLFILKND